MAGTWFSTSGLEHNHAGLCHFGAWLFQMGFHYNGVELAFDSLNRECNAVT
jgi:hypothetical protein